MKTKERPRPVHWLSSLPTPYNDYLFQALSQCPDIDLTVHYRERISSAHPWRTQLGQGHNSRYYHLRGGVDWTILNIARHDKEAFFVIAGWEHLTSMLLITFLALTGRRFALWTDTPNLHRKRKPLFAFLRSQWLRWVFQRGTKIMGTGRPGVEALRNMGAPAAALVEFPFFLDLQRYAPPDRLSVTQGHPMRFISSGRLQNDRKGHDLALRAFAFVAHKRGFNGEYLIAGTGPDETRLRELSRALGLEEQVRFLGWVEPDALADLYRSCHVLVHPSPVHDPFPNAVLEAMAAGLAILGSDVSGSVLDRVEHGINGLIHRAGDVTQLADHVEYLLTNPDVVERMGQRARETALRWPVERGVEIVRQMVLAGDGEGER